MKKPKMPSLEECIEISSDANWSKFCGPRDTNFEKDEKFYTLGFKDELNLPLQYQKDAIVLPTARDMPDTFVDNIDIQNVRVTVNKKGTSEKAKEAQEMERKFYLGTIHRTNVESPISPWRQAAKHFAYLGCGVLGTFWDADRWVDKPEEKEGESEEDYAIRLDEWRAETHLSLPIIIRAIHPAWIMPDPYTTGQLYVVERRKKLRFEAERVWPHWKNPQGKGPNDEVVHKSYWDEDYRCELVDGEPILRIKGGVVNHKYGFIPYTIIESGLGNLDKDASLAERYVGILRYMYDVLISESRNYTNNDILIKWETMKGGYITGPSGQTIPEVKQAYGEYSQIPEGVEFHEWGRKLPPAEAYTHLALTRDYIDSHAGPRVMRGLESNIRSGAQERFRVSQASVRYAYATPAFQNGTSLVLAKCAMLVKNVIPGEFNVWAKTPHDEIDVVIKKDLLKEPFAPYVEFSPISEEDEYRRHDDIAKMVQQGIYTREFAWTQMNNVDPAKMAKDVAKAQLRASPMFNQLKDQYLSQRFQEVVAPPAPVAPQPGASPTPPPTPAPPPQGGMPVEGQRGMVPPIPEKAPIGSAQELENQIRAREQATSSGIITQGRGGGGAR